MRLRCATRSELAWCLYDWANSAFATSILAALLPVYFARTVVPQNGVRIHIHGWSWHTEAASLWAYAVSLSLLAVALCAPVLGVIADRGPHKKRLLLVSAYFGAASTLCLIGATPGAIWYTLLCFLAAHVGFAGSEVFYNAYLPELVPADQQDWLSGLGYAYGYAGGGLLLALHLLFLTFHTAFGIADPSWAVRLCLASVGAWWALFTLPAALWLPESPPVVPKAATGHGSPHQPGTASSGPGLPPLHAVWSGLRQVASTLGKARLHRNSLVLLLAFFFYNDGIQTVISMAAIYGATELKLSQGTLLGVFLLTQFVAFPGALLFSRWAQAWNNQRVLLVTLFTWCLAILYAYRMRHDWEFWMLGTAVGIVLGGSQALSRSLYSQLIPWEQRAEFFGLFAVGSKFASILGPFTFGVVRDVTGNSRTAILSTLVFFAVGMLVLAAVKPLPRGPGARRQEG
jgi:UMF1 family MFS transporter